MALDDVRQSATSERLDAMTVPDVGCTAEARQAALGRVRSMGLPQGRDEYWKFTKPNTLVQSEAPAAALFVDDESPVFSDFDRLKIVFVDGVFDPDMSDDLTLERRQRDL